MLYFYNTFYNIFYNIFIILIISVHKILQNFNTLFLQTFVWN